MKFLDMAFVVDGRKGTYRTVLVKGENIEMQDYDKLEEAEDAAALLAWADNLECRFVDDPDGMWADLRIKQLEERYG